MLIYANIVEQELNISMDNLYNTKLDNLHEQNKKCKDKEQQYIQLILHITPTYRICRQWTLIMKKPMEQKY